MSDNRHHTVRAIEALASRARKKAEALGNNTTANRLLAEVNRLRSGAEALDNVRQRRSPLDTPEAHALKVGRLAKKFEAETLATLNRSLAILGEGLKDVGGRIDRKVNLTPDAFASEIRAAFRSLDREAKTDLLGRLVKENRGPELAAIVKAPGILTGISDQERQAYEKAIIAQNAPDELDEQQALQGVWEEALAANNAATQLAKAFVDPGKLAAIESADAAAAEAGAAFDQSMQ